MYACMYVYMCVSVYDDITIYNSNKEYGYLNTSMHICMDVFIFDIYK